MFLTSAVLQAFGTEDLERIKQSYNERDKDRARNLGKSLETSIIEAGVPEGRWLDYGCGPAPLEFKKQVVRYNRVGDCPVGPFAAAILSQVLHHTKNKERVIAEVSSRLVPGGLLAVFEPERIHAAENIDLDRVYYEILGVEELEVPKEEDFLMLEEQDVLIESNKMKKLFSSGPRGVSRSRLSLYRKLFFDVATGNAYSFGSGNLAKRYTDEIKTLGYDMSVEYADRYLLHINGVTQIMPTLMYPSPGGLENQE